jgi:hypothetical protein
MIGWMMMNWKGLGRKWWWPNFKVLSWHSPGGTEKITKTLNQGTRLTGPRFKPGTFRIRRSVNHSTITFRNKASVFFSMVSMFSLNIEQAKAQIWAVVPQEKKNLFSPTILTPSTQARSWRVPFSFRPSRFSWTLLTAYSKAKLKITGDKASPCFRPFLIRNLSDFCPYGLCCKFHLNTF